MIVTSCEHIAGKRIAKTLGLVKGNTIRARHIGRDIGALFRTIVGGEVKEYTKLLAESREQAVDRMVNDAKAMNADAIIMVRFSTSAIMTSAAELLAYGTAVLLKDE
ncbi:MAG: YbjQ family protein [Candidatus Zixiibacteriota bacterium]